MLLLCINKSTLFEGPVAEDSRMISYVKDGHSVRIIGKLKHSKGGASEGCYVSRTCHKTNEWVLLELNEDRTIAKHRET